MKALGTQKWETFGSPDILTSPFFCQLAVLPELMGSKPKTFESQTFTIYVAEICQAIASAMLILSLRSLAVLCVCCLTSVLLSHFYDKFKFRELIDVQWVLHDWCPVTGCY